MGGEPQEKLQIKTDRVAEQEPEGKNDPDESLPLDRAEIEKRLQFLEELYQEGTLSPEAYEEKKKLLEKHYESLPAGGEQ